MLQYAKMVNGFFIFALIISILSVKPGLAQYSEWQNFTCGDIITAAVADGQYLWVGTEGGLVKVNLNDKQATFFNKVDSKLPANQVMALALGPDGNLWIGTLGGGLVRFDKGTVWEVYNMENSGLPTNDVLSLAVGLDNTIWVGTKGKGLAAFDGDQTWTYYTKADSQIPEDDVLSLLVAQDGKIWVGTTFGLAVYNGSVWKAYGRYTTGGLPSNTVYCLIEGTDGIWVGTSYGTAHFDRDTTWNVYRRMTSDLPSDRVYAIVVESDSVTWFGTDLGLAMLKDTTWTVYQTGTTGLPDNVVKALCRTAGGVLWVGTEGGLARLENDNWDPVPTSQTGLPGSKILSILADGNNGLWFGTMINGLARKQGNNWATYDPSNSPLLVYQINDLIDDSTGAIWVAAGVPATNGNLVKIMPDTILSYEARVGGLPGYNVLALFTDKAGTLWVGTAGNDGSPPGDDGGVAKYIDDTTWVVYDKDNSGLQKNEIPAIAEDIDGSIWFSVTEAYMSGGVGVARFDRDTTWTSYQNGMVGVGLPHNYVTSIVIDEAGTKWFGTWGGLASLDSAGTWTVFDTSNSPLPHDRINRLMLDNDGNLWIGTENGLALFNRTDTWTIYTLANSGLPNNQITELYLDATGNKWIGTGGGATVCNACNGGVGIGNRFGSPTGQMYLERNIITNFPNPFSGTITIEIKLQQPDRVKIDIFSIKGNHIFTVADSRLGAGVYRFKWDGSDVKGRQAGAGVYTCKINKGKEEIYAFKAILNK